LQNNTISRLFVGQNLITLKEADSTNNYLKNILSNSKPVPEGTVIMAERQYAGRGQQQNRWHSQDEKNLTFSLLLNPVFLPVSAQFDLTRAVNLGVHDALEPLLGDKLKIKWPNDIYYADHKLGGILIENLLQGSTIKQSIIGIGLNVNQDKFPEWVPNPISIKQILQQDYDLQALLLEICSHIEGWYLCLKAGKTEQIRQAYLNNLYWLKQEHKFKAKDGTFTATITGVEDSGALRLKSNIGAELKFSFKEIEFLNK
jgi:BirA family transcriptional regulator, biotin operon repressor / biotin---[acetyl-CoA-carboxylase] ligase